MSDIIAPTVGPKPTVPPESEVDTYEDAVAAGYFGHAPGHGNDHTLAAVAAPAAAPAPKPPAKRPAKAKARTAKGRR